MMNMRARAAGDDRRSRDTVVGRRQRHARYRRGQARRDHHGPGLVESSWSVWQIIADKVGRKYYLDNRTGKHP